MRKRANSKREKMRFRRTANKVKAVNIIPSNMRGGQRL